MNERRIPVPVILDTDIGGDCDDAGALAVLHAFCDRGEAELLVVTHCYSAPELAGCISAVNTYCGRPEIPIGVMPREAKTFPGTDVYASALCREFPNAYSCGREAENSVRVMRRALAQSRELVTIVVIGSMGTMAAFLQSPGDDISPLNGIALAKQKVRCAVIMGGRFHESWPQPYVLDNDYVVDVEFNMKADISSAQTFSRLWPCEMIYCSYEIGWGMLTGIPLVKEGKADNPIRRAYQIVCGEAGRDSWDLATVLYAVRPDAKNWMMHPFGRITVDDSGVTRWEIQEQGRHTYLLPNRDPEEIRRELDALMEEAVARHDART